MEIKSPTFEDNEEIPADYTCDGDDISPPLQFSGVPEDAASLTLIISDPDAPGGTFYHWVVFNIDPGVSRVAEDTIPEGGVSGTTDFQSLDYGGPCPPTGKHRYIFKLYALDGLLDLDEGVTARDVIDAMDGHILETAGLSGIYGK